MISLVVNRTGCSVAFSSITERDTFARRARRAHLRVIWIDQAHCISGESATGSLLRVLTQDSDIVLKVATRVDDEQPDRDSDSPQPKQEIQLSLW